MTSELISFIENAIKEQDSLYRVAPHANGFVLFLSLDGEEQFLKENEVPEAFKITVDLTSKNDKLVAILSDEILAIKKDDKGNLSLGDHIDTSESIGACETETVTAEDGWKIFIAKRWLISILKFKNYAIKEPKRDAAKRTSIVIVSIIVLGIFAAIFVGTANQMANNGLNGDDQTTVTEDTRPDAEVLDNFFG